MSYNHSLGRHRVLDINGLPIGIIDGDEFIRQGSTLIYRIDGAEVYDLDDKFLAFIEEGIARTPSGQKLFSISAE